MTRLLLLVVSLALLAVPLVAQNPFNIYFLYDTGGPQSFVGAYTVATPVNARRLATNDDGFIRGLGYVKSSLSTYHPTLSANIFNGDKSNLVVVSESEYDPSTPWTFTASYVNKSWDRPSSSTSVGSLQYFAQYDGTSSSELWSLYSSSSPYFVSTFGDSIISLASDGSTVVFGRTLTGKILAYGTTPDTVVDTVPAIAWPSLSDPFPCAGSCVNSGGYRDRTRHAPMAFLDTTSITTSFLLHTWGSDIYYVGWDGSQFVGLVPRLSGLSLTAGDIITSMHVSLPKTVSDPIQLFFAVTTSSASSHRFYSVEITYDSTDVFVTASTESLFYTYQSTDTFIQWVPLGNVVGLYVEICSLVPASTATAVAASTTDGAQSACVSNPDLAYCGCFAGPPYDAPFAATPTSTTSSASTSTSSALSSQAYSIGLGVGLGVGIPCLIIVILVIVFFSAGGGWAALKKKSKNVFEHTTHAVGSVAESLTEAGGGVMAAAGGVIEKHKEDNKPVPIVVQVPGSFVDVDAPPVGATTSYY